MLQQKLTNLKDFILTHNSYYDKGYDNVVMDDSTGQINDGKQLIFPADDIGNYFYLRLPNDVRPDYQFPSIADSHLSIGIRYDVILVAILDDGDNSLMAENLMTTLGRYQKDNLAMTKVVYQTDSVILQELSRLSKEDKESALQKFPETCGICSIHFSFTIPFIFQQLRCLTKPCKNC